MEPERKLQALQIHVGEMFKPALEVVHKIASAELTRVVDDKQVATDEDEKQFLNGLEESYSRFLNEAQILLDMLT